MNAAVVNLEKKLSLLKSDLHRSQTILREGGFTDADGDWNGLSDEAKHRREAEVTDLSARVAKAEAALEAARGGR